jgi:hypothetical protein
LRRSAARDWRRHLSEAEIMRLCGWKTRTVFDRYNIVSPEDVRAGIARRFSGKQAANSEPSDAPAEGVS